MFLYERGIMIHSRPIHHLNAVVKLYPNISAWVDEFREDSGKGLPKWPDWCFLPMAAWYAIVSTANKVRTLPLHLVGDVSKLAAIGTWRYSQGIYHVDNTLLNELIDSPISGSIPSEVLYRLPEWCLYIETPDLHWLNDKLYGFWVHLEWDANSGRSELRLLLDTENALIGIPLHIGAWTVTEAVDRAMAVSKLHGENAGISFPFTPDAVQSIATEINPLISVLLYLCSQEPDIDDTITPQSFPERPRPKKTKKGWRLFPADKPRVWAVGASLGQKLRQSLSAEQGEPTNRTVRAHLRRGHWHGYWKGAHQGERKFIYKWIPPIVVGQRVD